MAFEKKLQRYVMAFEKKKGVKHCKCISLQWLSLLVNQKATTTKPNQKILQENDQALENVLACFCQRQVSLNLGVEILQHFVAYQKMNLNWHQPTNGYDDEADQSECRQSSVT